MMCDAQCRKCRKRFGWRGPPDRAPPCPRCGATIPAEDVAKDMAEIAKFRAMLASPDCLRCDGTGSVLHDGTPYLCKRCQGTGKKAKPAEAT